MTDPFASGPWHTAARRGKFKMRQVWATQSPQPITLHDLIPTCCVEFSSFLADPETPDAAGIERGPRHLRFYEARTTSD